MPKYARRTTRGARRYAPYRRRKASGLVRTMRSVAKRVVYRQREAKLQCQSTTTTALTTTWQLIETLNNTVAQGDGPSDRDGLKIRVSGIRLKIQLALASDRAQAMRLLIIRKKEDFVAATDLPGTTVRPMIGCVTPAMKRKYQVLCDQIVNPAVRVDDSGTLFRHVYLDKYLKINAPLSYSGSAATDLDVGRIYVYACTDNLAGGTDHIDYASESVMYFKDM